MDDNHQLIDEKDKGKIRIRGIIILVTLVQHKTPLPGFKQHDPDRKAGESASA